MASAGGMSTVSRPVRWLLSRPSICTLLASRDWPFTSEERLSWELKNSECGRYGRVEPGTVAIMPWKFLLNDSGMADTWMLSIVRPMSVRSVCSSGVSPVTVTVSSRPPTSSARSMRTLVFGATRTPSRTVVLKPSSAAFTL